MNPPGTENQGRRPNTSRTPFRGKLSERGSLSPSPCPVFFANTSGLQRKPKPRIMGESQTPHPPAGFAGSPGCFNPPDPNISFSFPFLPFVCPSSSSSSSSFKYSFYVQRFKKEKKVKGFFFFFPVLFCWPTGHFAHRLGHFLPHRHHLARPPTSGQRGPLLGQAPPFPGEDVSLHRSSSRAHICRSTHDKEDGAGGPSSVPPGGVVVCRRGFSSLFCKVP